MNRRRAFKLLAGVIALPTVSASLSKGEELELMANNIGMSYVEFEVPMTKMDWEIDSSGNIKYTCETNKSPISIHDFYKHISDENL
jgi:hypothetical protein